MNEESGRGRNIPELLLAGALAVAYWSLLAITPSLDWNSARIFPAFLVSAGLSPYSPPGEGPATGWIYGPVMPIVHLPATWIGDITGAMLVSALINAVVLLAPLVWLVHQAIKRSDLSSRQSSAVWLMLFGAFVVAPTLRSFLYTISCDEVAIAAAMWSCVFLADAGPPDARRLVLAAFFAITAVWTKQIDVVVPIAQLAYLWIADRDRRRFGRYLLSLAGVAAMYVAVMVAWFGFTPLVFNLWIVPAGHSLKGAAETMKLAAQMAAELLPLLVLVGWIAREQRRRAVPAASPIVPLLLTVGAVLLPVNLLGASKVGGGLNSFHALPFFFAAAMISIVRMMPLLTDRIGAGRVRSLAAGVALAGILGICGIEHVRFSPSPHLAAQLEFAQAHPKQTYFPLNPLVTWWSDHRAYHLEYGLIDQAVSGYPATRERYLGYLPPDLKFVFYRAGGAQLAPQVLPGLKPLPQAGPFQVYRWDRAEAQERAP